MACFTVSAVEAIAVTVAEKVLEKKEKEAKVSVPGKDGEAPVSQTKIPFSAKLKWLRNMLWGGTVLLAFEHVWHGEITPWFPFLTAMANPADTAEMLHEIATVGVAMAVLVTAVWLVMVGVSSIIEKRAAKEDTVPAER